MTEAVRIYVDGKPVDAPPGVSLAEALDGFDPSVGAEVRAGKRGVTDSRGLPADLTAPVYAGAIFRIIGRGAATEDPQT